jgi:multicomponent Na+:H+ antiporter subunit A
MFLAEMTHFASLLLILLVGVLFSLMAKKVWQFGVVAVMAPILSWSCLIQYQIFAKNDEPSGLSISWIPALNVSIDLELNSLNTLMLHLILGIGSLIVIYAYGYFEKFSKFNRFLGLVLLFMFAMSGLVLSNNLMLTFIFWELTSILSFFLVAFYYEKQNNRDSAKRALVVTTTGALFLLAGLIMLGEMAGTYRISEIVTQTELKQLPLIDVTAIFIILGCLAKSAQFPFHFWLPGAMSAPTPASAYLHSATMVKAGVFLMASFSPIFNGVVSWDLILMTLGSVTLIYGAYQSIFCEDLKAILAYTTIAILGALTMLIGLGTEKSLKAFAVLLMAHALYKATLFMIAGIIDLSKGTRSLKQLGGLKRRLFLPFLAAILAALSMSGIPGTLGFLAKEYKYKALISLDQPQAWIFGLVGVLSSALMMYSAFQVAFRPFIKVEPIGKTEAQDFTKLRSFFLFVPALLLGLTSILLGLFPKLVSPLVADITKSLSGSQPDAIKVWNGLNLALGLSFVTLTIGMGLWLSRHKISMLNFKPHGTHSFEIILKKLTKLAVYVSDYLKS